MDWRKIKILILAFIAAFLLILVTGVTVTEDVGDIQIFKMGTDVVVPAGRVMTDAVALGGNVTVLNEGRVTSDAVAIGGNVILMDNARVSGDALAVGGQIIKEPGAIVEGSEVVIFGNAKVLIDRFGFVGTLYLINVIFSLIFLTIIFAFGIFLLLLISKQIKRITATMQQHSFKSGAWGLGAIVAVMLFAGLFSGSIFGYLLIPIINLIFVIASLLGAIATGLWIGQKILPRKETTFAPFIVGMLMLGVISLIPIAGGAIILMLALFGFGAVLLSRVGTMQPENIAKRHDRLENSAQPSRG